MKINIEIDLDSVIELLTKLREAESAYREQMDIVYGVYGSCDGSLMRAIQMLSSRTYQALELLGFEDNLLYDWVHESEEFLLFGDGFIYNLFDPLLFVKYVLNISSLSDFTPVGWYVEKDGKLIKRYIKNEVQMKDNMDFEESYEN